MRRRCLSGTLSMQDRFTGDIGDFAKYGLLRALAPPHFRLGIIWYLTPDGDSGGNRREYLDSPERFRSCDPSLFDALTAFHHGERGIAGLLTFPILPHGTLCVDEPVPLPSSREGWFERALSATEPCDLVYLDPDNGLAPRSIPRSRTTACHYVYPEEIMALQTRGQSVLVYHHLSRQGTAGCQIQDRLSQLGEGALAFRFHRGVSRTFFFLPSPSHQDLLAERVRAFLKSPWKEHFTLYEQDGNCRE
jgi:hypothetical protein